MFAAMCRAAWASLFRQRLRTTLTIAGIAIGVAAVVCTAALGAASAERVQSQIDNLGEDFLWIRPGSLIVNGAQTGWGSARTLTADDAAAIAATIPDIATCSPVAQGREQVVASGSNWNTRYQGVLPSYFAIRRRTAGAGVTFTDADVSAYARVVVLGSATASNLFQSANPIGRTVRMNGFPFLVIGVLAPRGADRSGLDRDDVAFVPYTTAYRNLDRREWVSDVMCAVTAPDRMSDAEDRASTLLRIRHGLPADGPDDFTIQKPLEVIEMRAQTSRTLALLLTAIGGVSLIVAGVGIMNIMLVSVAERSREIGVRLAIGARVRDIRWQFLLEAATLGLIGGLCGIAAGSIGARALSALFSWPTVVTADSVTIATASAVGAGLIFGYFPAHRASRLDPIEAIRDDT